jgi:hypothetical protein
VHRNKPKLHSGTTSRACDIQGMIHDGCFNILNPSTINISEENKNKKTMLVALNFSGVKKRRADMESVQKIIL